MYRETFNCKYGRVVYGADCKRCNMYKRCFVKGEKREKNEKMGAIPSD